MKGAIIILIILCPFFFSGGLAVNSPCICGAIRDTSILPADTAKRILADAIDTAFSPVLERLDSFSLVLDSLNTLLDSLRRERGKKKVLGRVDIWQRKHLQWDTLKWWYWLYGDGKRKYINTTRH